MMSWDELVRKLRSRRRMGENEAKVLIAEAYRKLCSEFRWKFLLGETMIVTLAPYSTGTVAVTKDSTAIAVTTGVWSLAWKRARIVIEGHDEPYELTVTGAGTGTLSTAWPWDSDADATYTIYWDRYALPEPCDDGGLLLVIDTANVQPLPLVGAFDAKLGSSFVLGETGTPAGIAHVELEQSGTDDPVSLVQLVPAPDAVYVYPAIYAKKAPTITSGTAKPLWPESFEDLIWRQAEIEWVDSNPGAFIDPRVLRTFYFRLFDCKKRNDGGAEISRVMQTYLGTSSRTAFRNINFTPGLDFGA